MATAKLGNLLPPVKVAVREIEGKGRGVVATQRIAAGEIIETCPLLFLSQKEAEYITKTADVLRFYALELTLIKRHVLHLGYGLLYNHDPDPNAEIQYCSPDAFLTFVALKDIDEGTEITYDYQFDGDPEMLTVDLVLPLGRTL